VLEDHEKAGPKMLSRAHALQRNQDRSTNEIAQKIQDVGGYINAYTSFDRTVFWIDVPKDGALTALDILADAMMNSTLPAQEYAKEQEVIRRELRMGWTIRSHDNAPAFRNRVSATSYRLPVIGLIDIYNNHPGAGDEYYKTRYVPNISLLSWWRRCGAEVREKLEIRSRISRQKSLPQSNNPTRAAPTWDYAKFTGICH